MRVLVVEDDERLASQLREALRESGFVVDLAGDGEQAQFLGETEPYDAVILDLGLPKADGVTILKRWRAAERAMPVLILTARDDWGDKVAGFRAGGDDYVVKPFRMEEVIVRLKALVRRAAGHSAATIGCGPLEFETQLSAFTLHGLPLKLTAFEHQVLAYLIHHAERPVSRTELSEHLYAYGQERDFNSLEVIVGRLRKKIGRTMIETIRGRGYRLTGASKDA